MRRLRSISAISSSTAIRRGAEPAAGSAVCLAGEVGRGLALFATAGIGIWLAFFNASMPWSAESRAAQAQRHVEHEARTVLDQLNILRKDEAAAEAVDEITREFHAIEATGDLQAIRECQTRMAAMLAKLNEQYEVQIVSGSTSLISRRWEKGGGVLAYYAIVEARSGGGKILTRSVMNSENRPDQQRDDLGEQIPKESLTVWPMTSGRMAS